MATFAKIPDFMEGAMEQEHFLGSGGNVIEIALSNVAPGSESSPTTTSGNGILANVTQISYTNYGDTLGTDRVLESVTSDESGGTWTFDAANFSITPVGGALATWRYLYVFNQTSTTPDDQLIGVWDHGSAVDLAESETANINIHANGLINIA